MKKKMRLNKETILRLPGSALGGTDDLPAVPVLAQPTSFAFCTACCGWDCGSTINQ